MRRAPLVLCVASMLALPAVAAAASPLRLADSGDRPWVFVDRQGITHVTWDVEEGLQTRTFYRRALPGSRAFSPAVELPVATGNDFAGTYITQDPAPSNRLVLITERLPSVTAQPQTYALSSADNGATWGAATAVAEPSPSANIGGGRVNLVANGPLGIWAINGNPSTRLIKIPGALTPLVTVAQQLDISPLPYGGQVAFDAAGQPVFAFGSIDTGYIRVGETGANQVVFTSSVVPSFHLAAGPRGTAVLWAGGSITDTAVRVRLLSGGTLAPEIRLSPANDDSVAVPYLSADQTGRFHAVWRTGTGALVYRRSETGANWAPTQTLVTGGNVVNRPYSPVVSAGPDGTGWAVYSTGTSKAPVLAVPIGATTDPSVPDTAGIDNPRVTRRGSSIFVTPRTPSLADLRRRKCVNVRVQTTKPASIRVAIFSGRRSIRIFGATVVRFRAPGKRLVCVRVPLRARTFDVRQPFRFAFAVRDGVPGSRTQKPARLTTTSFTSFR